MKKCFRQEFTIFRLTVAVAVISLLAAVFIPKINGIINRAKVSSALEEASAALDIYTSRKNETVKDGTLIYVNKSGCFLFRQDGGELKQEKANDLLAACGGSYIEKIKNVPALLTGEELVIIKGEFYLTEPGGDSDEFASYYKLYEGGAGDKYAFIDGKLYLVYDKNNLPGLKENITVCVLFDNAP